MSDTLNIFGKAFSGVEGIKAYDSNGNLLTFTKTSQASIVDTEDSAGGIIRDITIQDVVNLQESKTITPSSIQQIIYPDNGYDGLASVIVNANGESIPTFGIITTINITEPVATISYDLPEIALSYGAVWVKLDNIQLSTDDYIYCSVMPSNTAPGDYNGYGNKRSDYTGIVACTFGQNQTVNNVALGGYSGTAFSTMGTSRISYYTNTFVPTTLKMKLYYEGSTYNSGTITVYGRVS